MNLAYRLCLLNLPLFVPRRTRIIPTRIGNTIPSVAPKTPLFTSRPEGESLATVITAPSRPIRRKNTPPTSRRFSLDSLHLGCGSSAAPNVSRAHLDDQPDGLLDVELTAV